MFLFSRYFATNEWIKEHFVIIIIIMVIIIVITIIIKTAIIIVVGTLAMHYWDICTPRTFTFLKLNKLWFWISVIILQIDGFVQERRNSIANALELRLSYTNPSKLCVPGASFIYRLDLHVLSKNAFFWNFTPVTCCVSSSVWPGCLLWKPHTEQPCHFSFSETKGKRAQKAMRLLVFIHPRRKSISPVF